VNHISYAILQNFKSAVRYLFNNNRSVIKVF